MLIILILAGVIFYNTLFKSYKDQIYQNGVSDVFLKIIELAVQCERVTLPIGENQTINLIAEECLR